MTELVAATAFFPPSLKHQLLIFDRIAWPTACFYAPFAATEEEEARATAERQFLLERQIVFAPPLHVPSHPYFRGRPGMIKWGMIGDFTSNPLKWERASDYAARKCDEAARGVAIYLRRIEKVNAVPLTLRWTLPPDHQTTRTSVLQLVIKALPVPDDSHSIEDVLAFRDEMKQANLTQGLRVWMNKMATGESPLSHVSDELEYPDWGIRGGVEAPQDETGKSGIADLDCHRSGDLGVTD